MNIATNDRYDAIASKLRHERVTHLERVDLLEQACAIYYCSEHPEMRAYVAGASKRRHSAVTPPFAESFAAPCGIAPSSIRAYLAMARAIPEDVRAQLRRRASSPSRDELLELARRDADAQRAIVSGARNALLRGALGMSQVRKHRAPKAPPAAIEHASMAEVPFMQRLMLALGAAPGLRIHRQNVGKVIVRDRSGAALRTFDAGPPNGAADLSGIVGPEGWRIEIETKSADGDTSKQQRAWRAMVEAYGGIYVLVTYDASMTPEDNIALGVATVNMAIGARRAAAIGIDMS